MQQWRSLAHVEYFKGSVDEAGAACKSEVVIRHHDSPPPLAEPLPLWQLGDQVRQAPLGAAAHPEDGGAQGAGEVLAEAVVGNGQVESGVLRLVQPPAECGRGRGGQAGLMGEYRLPSCSDLASSMGNCSTACTEAAHLALNRTHAAASKASPTAARTRLRLGGGAAALGGTERRHCSWRCKS